MVEHHLFICIIKVSNRMFHISFTINFYLVWLTFEIFNRNVHNFLVDSGASSNVMPYSVCKNINAQPKMCRTKIIQLDISHVKVMGELKDVMIRLSSNSKVHQVIDVIVVDIPEAYGVILSRDWSAKLNGYFATD